MYVAADVADFDEVAAVAERASTRSAASTRG
jgi:hypothetical protein